VFVFGPEYPNAVPEIDCEDVEGVEEEDVEELKTQLLAQVSEQALHPVWI